MPEVVKLCECGCGKPAPIAKKTHNARGYTKGKQTRFIQGHSICLINKLPQSGEKASNWRGGKRKIQCDQCGEDIYRSLSRIKSAKTHFCSPRCQGIYAHIHKTGENSSAWKGGNLKVECTQCGKLLERIPAKVNDGNNFCDSDCAGTWMSIHQRGVNSSRWLGGITYLGYCPIWTYKEFKQYILERDGYKCQNPQCLGNGNQLHRHHIDYIKKNCEPNNIITLCNSCNSKANSEREWHMAYYQAVMVKNQNRYLKKEYYHV